MGALFDVIVIGGGASGVICCHHLASVLGNKAQVMLIDPHHQDRLGEGLAYKNRENAFLLNVPADRMGVAQKEAGDFLRWLEAQHPEVLNLPSYPFVPRYFYADYLQAKLKEVEGRLQFTHSANQAIRCHYEQGCWKVTTASKENKKDKKDKKDTKVLSAKALILATGYGELRVLPLFQKLEKAEIILSTEWERLTEILPAEEVLILGTGLGGLDAWNYLTEKKHQGKIHFLSRHGLFPQVFSAVKDAYPLDSLSGSSPRQLFSTLRHLLLKSTDPLDASKILLSLRRQSRAIWTSWSSKERRRFESHLDPLWKTFRHRMPQSVATKLEAARACQQVEVHAGRILTASGAAQAEAKNSKRISLTYKPRSSEQGASLTVDRIISALGPLPSLSVEIEKRESAEGLPFLWKVGPLNQAELGESTAIAEIREQAEFIAMEIGQALLGIHSAYSV